MLPPENIPWDQTQTIQLNPKSLSLRLVMNNFKFSLNEGLIIASVELFREGVASMIHELVEDLHGNKPSVIAVCVGGGGLLCGVVQGLHDVGWQDVPVVAMETEGANCLNESIKEDRVVKQDGITRYANFHELRSYILFYFNYRFYIFKLFAATPKSGTHKVLSHINGEC